MVRAARRPLPEYLPRERVVHPVPDTCACCCGDRLRKVGEDMIETLKLIPRKVIRAHPVKAAGGMACGEQ
jgi:transposase